MSLPSPLPQKKASIRREVKRSISEAMANWNSLLPHQVPKGFPR